LPHLKRSAYRQLVTFLTDDEVEAFLGSCNQDTWTGRRDYTILVLAIQTGLRISELAALTRADIALGTGANVHTMGKGRKERRTPLLSPIVSALRAWLVECDVARPDPLFPTSTGRHLSRDAIEHRVAHYVAMATAVPVLRFEPNTSQLTPCGTRRPCAY
jgi:integrase